jgi:hypothetical protein
LPLSANNPADGSSRNTRMPGDLAGSGGADIVGFGDDGVWTALGNGDGTFKHPSFVLADLGYEAGRWRVDKHVRVLADLRGKGRSDIVAFGDAGVCVALSNGDGSFNERSAVAQRDAHTLVGQCLGATEVFFDNLDVESQRRFVRHGCDPRPKSPEPHEPTVHALFVADSACVKQKQTP